MLSKTCSIISSQGTAISGIIAATKNGVCTTGVAYDAIVQGKPYLK